MWYEVLPSVAIVYVCLCVPPLASWGINYYFYKGKNCARRWQDHPADFQFYLRDRRITGSEYVHRNYKWQVFMMPRASQMIQHQTTEGLEALSDSNGKKSEC